MILLTDANAYINAHCPDVEYWVEADDDTKTRYLNVAERVLLDTYEGLIIPMEATCQFAAVLAAYFSDSIKYQQYDVASFALTGVTSFTYKQGRVKDLYEMIPTASKVIVGNVNGIKLTGKTVKWTVM